MIYRQERPFHCEAKRQWCRQLYVQADFLFAKNGRKDRNLIAIRLQNRRLSAAIDGNIGVNVEYVIGALEQTMRTNFLLKSV